MSSVAEDNEQAAQRNWRFEVVDSDQTLCLSERLVDKFFKAGVWSKFNQAYTLLIDEYEEECVAPLKLERIADDLRSLSQDADFAEISGEVLAASAFLESAAASNLSVWICL